jgi:hypothetical protein
VRPLRETDTDAADNAFVRITLDPFMDFVGAGLPAVDEGNHNWRFDLGQPASGRSVLQLVNRNLINGRFGLSDGLGRPVLSRAIDGDRVELGKVNVAPGVYFFRVFEHE